MLVELYCLLCAGNRTYVGYVYMECTQNHPVLHAFIEVLRTAAKQRADSRREHEECQDNETGSSGIEATCYNIRWIKEFAWRKVTAVKGLQASCICMYSSALCDSEVYSSFIQIRIFAPYMYFNIENAEVGAQLSTFSIG